MERFTRKIVIMFVMLQTVLYVAFLSLDLYGNNVAASNLIKFTIIILCFCYTLLPLRSVNKGILFYIRVGLFFTVISDLFLLLIDIYFYGVLTFILVQQCYGLRLDISAYGNVTSKKAIFFRPFLIRLLLQISITGVICLALQSFDIILDKLLISSAFYFLCILTNIIRAIKITLGKRKMAKRLLGERVDAGLVLYTIGMVLFLLCDINVGLFNLSVFISLPESSYQTIYNLSSILMWTFYAPSQVLIALSTNQ